MTILQFLLPVEGVVVWGEALHHEIFHNNKVIKNIFSCYFEQTDKPHFIHLSGHCLGALNAGADSTLQHLQQKEQRTGSKQSDPPGPCFRKQD